MHLTFAITGILTLFLAAWAVHIIRFPRKWRLWWLNQLGIVDLDSTSAQRRAWDRQMVILAIPLALLLLTASVSCAWWTIEQIGLVKRVNAGQSSSDAAP